LNSNLRGVQLNLGLAEFKQGHFSQAIAPFKAALRADPASLQVDTLLGMSYYGSTEFSKSVPYLQIAVKSEPENLELRGVLAQACLNIRQYYCALEQDQQINKINPDSAQAHMLSGEALDGLHRTDEAIAERALRPGVFTVGKKGIFRCSPGVPGGVG
jgi:tetratricopeptide (TPR) repeat protein